MKKKTAKKSAKSKAKPKKKSAAPKKSKSAKAKAKAKPKAKAKAKKSSKKTKASNWAKFVEQHGVVLASAKGPVPSVVEAIVGEPVVGSWWSHPKGQQIFDALSTIDDSEDIRCFKLVDHKITFVHRRLWPALAKLAQAGVLDAERVTAIKQEHTETGAHRNITLPFPDWVPADTLENADSLTVDEAKTQLGTWVA